MKNTLIVTGQPWLVVINSSKDTRRNAQVTVLLNTNLAWLLDEKHSLNLENLSLKRESVRDKLVSLAHFSVGQILGDIRTSL